MKIVITAVLSLLVGASVGHWLTKKNRETYETMGVMVFAIDALSKLERSGVDDAQDRLRLLVDLNILQGIRMREHYPLLPQTRANLMEVLDMAVRYRYPEIIQYLEERKAAPSPFEGQTVEIGGKRVAVVAEGSEEAFSEVIDRQTRAIRDYYEERLKPDEGSNSE